MDGRVHINTWYPFLHCLAIVAIGPLLWSLFYLDSSDSREILRLYPTYLLVGSLLATPLFVLYYYLLIFLSGHSRSLIELRLYAYVMMIVGIFLIARFIFSDETLNGFLSYSAAAVFSGSFFRLRASDRTPAAPETKLRNLFLLSLFSFLLAAVTVLLGYFRNQLLGIPEGAGSHNASFNIGFFIPAMLLSGLIAYFTAGHVIMGWREYKNLKLKIIALILTLPTIAFILYYIFNAFKYK